MTVLEAQLMLYGSRRLETCETEENWHQRSFAVRSLLFDMKSAREVKGSLLAKRVFLSCYCHEIYTVEADGLKKYNYTSKITILVNM